MTAFWIAAAIITALTLLILWVAFAGSGRSLGVTQTDLNKRLYHDRLDELKVEDEQGLTDDQSQLVSELQHNLLEDIPEGCNVMPKVSKLNSMLVLLPGILVVLLVSIGMYAKFGNYQKIEHWHQVTTNMDSLTNRVMNGTEDLTKQELSDFALGLRTKLFNEGDDPQGWFLLAKVGQTLNNLDMMIESAEKAMKLDPDNPRIVATYAQALMYTGDPAQRAQAERLMVLSLQKRPDSLELWSVYGFMALEDQEFQLAIDRWQRMLPLLDNNPQRQAMLKQSINFAKNQIKAQAEAQAEAAVEAPRFDAAGKPIYQIQVDVAPEVRVPASSFLFVFAQAENGPPMPIAARKIAHPQFPLTINLSDNDGMMQGIFLSNQGDFKVTARLSYDDNVQTLEGDWEATKVKVKQGQTEPVKLIINTRL